MKVPLAGETTIRQVGVGVDAASASPCFSAERAGVVELVGRLQGERLDALQRALGDAGQGAGRRHLEDAGDAEVDASSPCTGPSGPGWRPGRRSGAAPRGRRGRPGRRGWRSAGVRGSWVETERRQPARRADGRGHVLGVEGAGHRQRRQPRLGRRVVGERRELLEGAGGDDLAGAVVVGGGQPVLVERGQHLVAVAAEHRGHAGRGDRRRPRPSPCRARGPAPSPARR